MGIFVNEQDRSFCLQTASTEYQMKVSPIGVLQHLYYGPRLFGQDMDWQVIPLDRGFSGNPYESRLDRGVSLDTIPQEFTGSGVGDFRLSSLSLIGADGSRSCDLRYQGYEISQSKSLLPGLPSLRQLDDEVEELKIFLEDELLDLRVTLVYSVLVHKDIIARRAIVENKGNAAIRLEKVASMAIDFQYRDFDLLHFHGRHCMERQLERQAVGHDSHVVGSRRGMSSHQDNPFVILCDRTTTEDHGDAYGFMLVYSGNHKTEVEKSQADSTRLVMGIHDENFSWTLDSAEQFFTPEVLLAYSPDGLNGLSRHYHRIIRDNLCPPRFKTVRRPVLINNWEATYFDFDTAKILDIAKSAAELGVDMLVLDDGWFGQRHSDNAGLGDWVVNEQKLPGGLKVIADGVNDLGMKFGLWFEPEMINEDSDLYRAHPDWVLADPGRSPMMSRNQLILDMGNPEVVDYLFESMSKVLASANIAYVKWDFNRSMANVYSSVLPADRQGETAHRFILGTYQLLDRLLVAFPSLMIEGCAGGGGRFDAGMLYYCPQIWTSDNTDALSRLFIQHGTSYGYPVSAMGAHVSAVPNHQTGREVSLNTRGVVAMSGTFGYELDLTQLTADEKDLMRQQISTYQSYYWLINRGDYYRLTNPHENKFLTAWQFVSEDGEEVLLNAVVTHLQANPIFPCLRLKGLEQEAKYQLVQTGQVFTGAALMYGGYVLQEIHAEPDALLRGNYPAFQLHFKKIA